MRRAGMRFLRWGPLTIPPTPPPSSGAPANRPRRGGGEGSDWLDWEQSGNAPPSGDGNGFRTAFADDFALLADHGLTAHQLTLEWARLEPVNGKPDQAAVEHYREVLEVARDAGVGIWACLHHTSLPGWFGHDERGFATPAAAPTSGPATSTSWPRRSATSWPVGPVHEPARYALNGWLGRGFPPGRNDPTRFTEALETVHLAAFEAAGRLRGAGPPVATAHALAPVQAIGPEPIAASWARRLDDVLWSSWIGAIRDGVLQVLDRAPIERPELRDAFDLVGFTYDGALGIDGAGNFQPYPPGRPQTRSGSVPWPEGLGVVLHRGRGAPHSPLL